MTTTNEAIFAADDPQATERMTRVVRDELASGRRQVYRFALVGAAAMLAVLLALWITEPRPLPTRLHVSLGVMSAIAAGWVVVLGRTVLRGHCPTADDRVATARMAVVASVAFLIAVVAVTVMRSAWAELAILGAVGVTLSIAAAVMLRDATRWRESLRRQLL